MAGKGGQGFFVQGFAIHLEVGSAFPGDHDSLGDSPDPDKPNGEIVCLGFIDRADVHYVTGQEARFLHGDSEEKPDQRQQGSENE